MSKLNDFLRKHRVAAGLTQRQLAGAIGCHSQQIYNFEAGYAVLPLKYLKKAGKALMINSDELKQLVINEKIKQMERKC